MFVYMGSGAELGMGEFHQACKLILKIYEMNFHTVFLLFSERLVGGGYFS